MTPTTTKPRPRARAGTPAGCLRRNYLRRWNENQALSEKLAAALDQHRDAHERGGNELRLAELGWVREVLQTSLGLLRVDETQGKQP